MLARKSHSVARSAERDRLAEAIAAGTECDARIARLQAALDAIRPSLIVAEVDDAKGRLIEAQQAAARSLAEAAVTGGKASSTVPAMRAEVQEAEDRLAAARAARQQVEAELADLRSRRPSLADRVRRAAIAVMQAEGAAAVTALANDVERLQRELLNKALELRFLVRNDIGDLADRPSPTPYGQPITAPARIVDRRTSVAPLGWTDLEKMVAGARPWQAALDALLADADAPLP